MASFRFARQVDRWAKGVDKKLNGAVRIVAINVFSEVILKTPVDTGRARGNWLIDIGNIPNGTVEIDDKSGRATIGKVTAKAQRLRVGQVVYLVNNLPYITALENGHSKQAPAGMVGLTVQRWQSTLDNAVRQVGG